MLDQTAKSLIKPQSFFFFFCLIQLVVYAFSLIVALPNELHIIYAWETASDTQNNLGHSTVSYIVCPAYSARQVVLAMSSPPEDNE